MLSTGLVLLLFVGLVALTGSALAWLSQPAKHAQDAENSRTPKELATNDNPVTTEPSLEELIEAVNQKLPQTQCAQCGYPGCRPYASAIVNELADINQCPPGGESLIVELAHYLGKEAIPLDTARGEHKPPQLALIDEAACIGCTLCIVACPVDAIVGASRLMHTVINSQCTGCELCLPPCPVDCISLIPSTVPLSEWRWPKPV